MRKALIIGLGGTGTSICNWLAERLKWEFGSLERTSFVDFYCVDTATDIAGTSPLLNDPTHFKHISIPDGTFKAMKNAPKSFDSQNRLSQWYNQEVLTIKNAVTDGTTGIRMLGRMALLLPANWTPIYDTINAKLTRLVNLQPAEAREKFGAYFDGSRPDIDFPNRVYVYILATACGGTGSGTIIEMGYLLRQLKERHFPDVMTTMGIITLPSSAETMSEKKANAYATLMELNHFSTDYNDYHDKYPNIPTPVTVYNYPFDFPYLVTVDVARAQKGGLKDFSELNYTVAQYIYSDIMFDVAAIRDGRRDNVSRHFISSDRKGLSQRFMTFGVSFIQYPVERIMRGCTYKLLAHSFDRWIGDHGNRVPNDVALSIKITPEEICHRLSQTHDGGLEARVDRNIQNLLENYAGVHDITALQQLLQAAFQEPRDGQVARDAPDPDLPTGFIPFIRGKNLGAAPAECIQRLREHITAALFDINRGVSYCLQFLLQLHVYLQSRQAATYPVDDEEMNAIRAILQTVEEDVLLRFPLPLGGRVEDHYLEQWGRAAKQAYHARLRLAMQPGEQQICRQLDEEAALLLTRLANLNTYIESGKRRFHQMWEEQDRAFNINGILLYRPGSTSDDKEVSDRATINLEYRNQLKSQSAFSNLEMDKAEAAAMAAVVGKIVTLAISADAQRSDLFAFPGRSRFDSGSQSFSEFRSSDTERCVEQAKGYFLGVKDINVVKAFQATYDPTERKKEIRRAADISDWFLPLDRNAVDFDDLTEKRYRWAFYAGAEDKEASDDLREFQDELRGNVPEGTEIKNLSDTHTAIFLSEYGAFPLRIIQSLSDWRQYYADMMGLEHSTANGNLSVADPNAKRVPTLFNREDIVWVAFDEADRNRLYEAEELFLVGLAIGKITSVQGGGGFLFEAREELPGQDPLVFDSDLRKSARHLNNSPNYLLVLRHRIHLQRRNGDGDVELIRCLYRDFLAGKFRVIGLLGVPGKNEQEKENHVRGVFNRFIMRDRGLLATYKAEEKPQIDFSLLYHQEGAVIHPTEPTKLYPKNGYYCMRCHLLFGDNPGDVPEICWNPSCREQYFHDAAAPVTHP